MATKKVTDKATVSNQVEADLDNAEAAAAGSPSLLRGLKDFGRDVFLQAAEAATKSFKDSQKPESDIDKLSKQIMIKREGISGILYKHAVKCTALTMIDKDDKKVADLPKAAELMRLSCGYAEDLALEDFKHRNPEATGVKINHIAPSWYVLKSEYIGAMRLQSLNPEDFPGGSAMVAAYREKRTADNGTGAAGQTAAGAAAPGTSRTGGAASTATHTPAPGNQLVPDGTVGKLTDSAKSMLANLAVALCQLDEKGQAKAVDILTGAMSAIRNIAGEAPEAGEKLTKHPPIPARESDSARVAQQ